MPSFLEAADQEQYDEQFRDLGGHQLAGLKQNYLPLGQNERQNENAVDGRQQETAEPLFERLLVPVGALVVAVLVFAAQLMVIFETRYRFDWNAGSWIT